MNFTDIVNRRYATKKFDGSPLPQEKVDQFKEIIRMSASSFGLQPWKVKIVTDTQTKIKLQAASWNQEQITTCSHLFIFCANTQVSPLIEEYQKMLEQAGTPSEKAKAYTDIMRNSVGKLDHEGALPWTKNQTYIAMSNAINGAVELGFDSCPMEGFDTLEYAKILGLPQNLVPVVVVPIGIGVDEPKLKLRYKSEELFF